MARIESNLVLARDDGQDNHQFHHRKVDADANALSAPKRDASVDRALVFFVIGAKTLWFKASRFFPEIWMLV